MKIVTVFRIISRLGDSTSTLVSLVLWKPTNTLVPGTYYTGILRGIWTDHMVEDIQELLNRINSPFYRHTIICVIHYVSK